VLHRRESTATEAALPEEIGAATGVEIGTAIGAVPVARVRP
jgi:hypothetical protein